MLIAIAWTLWLGLHRARAPGDARLFVAASAATMVALLVGGKVLSPQFLVWLLPVGFVVVGRYGPAAAGLTAAAMLLTFAYFPHHYWDLVALDSWPIAVLVLRDNVLIALLAACWPRPSIAGRPLGRVLGQQGADPKTAERAVSARYLVDRSATTQVRERLAAQLHDPRNPTGRPSVLRTVCRQGNHRSRHGCRRRAQPPAGRWIRNRPVWPSLSTGSSRCFDGHPRRRRCRQMQIASPEVICRPDLPASGRSVR